MATVELAAAVPMVLLLLVIGLGAVDAARARIACVDAAREGARAAARADDAAGAHWAARVAPAGSEISVSRDEATVTVTVSSDRRILGLPGARLRVTGTATAAIEPDAPP